MSSVLLAEFTGADALLQAAQGTREVGFRTLDAFSPFAVDGLAEAIGSPRSHVRVAMFVGGVGIAALAYWTEWYSAVFDYAINSGGRPLNSWPAFMLFPFAIGILGAAIAGLIALLVQSGLPRLHHPLFDVLEFDLASRNRFFLCLRTGDMRGAREFLEPLRPLAIREVAS